MQWININCRLVTQQHHMYAAKADENEVYSSTAWTDSACAPGTTYIARCRTIRGSIPACLLLGDYIIYLSTASRICCPAILLETAVSFCFLGRSSSCETLCTHMFGIELAPSCDTPCTHDACLHICNKRCWHIWCQFLMRPYALMQM